ncbi:MAG: glycogen synthase [Actinobacteria bacterium]|nr:glycogen synthase [Actinomycetota bacterium]
MRVLYVTQEYAPLAAEGGLGLTSRALPAALQLEQGVEHTLVMPYYTRQMAAAGTRTVQVDHLPAVTIGGRTCSATVHRLIDDPGPCEVLAIRADDWYDRDGIYRDVEYVEYADAVPRAAFFGWCVATWLQRSGQRFDIVHANDWQSGAAIAHLRRLRVGAAPRLLMNVHSGVYHGTVAPAEVSGLGLDAQDAELVGRDGEPSLLLLGLQAADATVTCSPTYAQELCRTLAHHPIGRRLTELGIRGIISGVDTRVWDPAAAGRATEPYDAPTVETGKAVNKRRLQLGLGLHEDPLTPVFGVCSRLVEEKGSDLLIEVFRRFAGPDRAQLVVVGQSEETFRRGLTELARDMPAAVHYGPHFDQDLAWLVYAGSDFTVMPSRVEPCGLNQLIAMAYGTIPVVSRVGGLKDTVADVRDDPSVGSGFVLGDISAVDLAETVSHAAAWLLAAPDEVRAVRQRCMASDWSWSSTAIGFAKLYAELAPAG